MTLRDLGSRIEVASTLAAQTITGNGTTNLSSAVDGSDAISVCHIANVGASGDTLSGSLYHTFKLQESDDNSTYTDVALDDVLVFNANTQVSDPDTTNSEDVVIDAAAEDPAILKFVYKGHKQYTKLANVKTGNHSTGTPMSMCAIVERRHMPAL